MSTASCNCPCCGGGPLKFSGESGKLECTACGNNYEPDPPKFCPECGDPFDESDRV